MNKIFRKRQHIWFVEHQIFKLHQEIFSNAIHAELSPIKAELYKKYNRYLTLLKF
jgi:hypothetical protein